MTTTTATSFIPATQAQIDFVSDLLRTRDVEPRLLEATQRHIAAGTLNRATASFVIDHLRFTRRRVIISPERKALNDLLDTLPSTGKFAISAVTANMAMQDKVVNNDYIFVEVSQPNRQRARTIRQLHGAVGSFTRTGLSLRDSTELAKLLLLPGAALEATQKFGELYQCCGKCGADLTDETSRKLMLGPVCRGYYGI